MAAALRSLLGGGPGEPASPAEPASDDAPEAGAELGVGPRPDDLPEADAKLGADPRSEDDTELEADTEPGTTELERPRPSASGEQAAARIDAARERLRSTIAAPEDDDADDA